MSSTRNKNSLGDYTLEINKDDNALNNRITQDRIYNKNYLPGNGLLPCSMPLNIRSKDNIDVETFLFGINSTNLVFPKKETVLPDMNTLDYLNLSKKLPVILPSPIVIDTNERPYK